MAQKLKDTAIDLGETGRDNTFGYGRADAIESITESSTSFDLNSRTPFPDEYTVNSTGDGADDDTSDGACDDGTVEGSTNCTLRAAIQQANAGSGAVINFNIPGSSYDIQPGSALPTINQPVFIDGYSQPGASAGTVLIELDGSSAGTGVDGLTLTGDGSHIRGLAVNSFGGNDFVLQGRGGGQVLAGNRIGTDTGRATDEGNGAAGVYINGAPDVVIRENLVSGNTTHGIHISGSRSSGAVIYGNTIGLNAAGTSDLGNSSAGVYINGASYATLRDNVISGNDSHGVVIYSGADFTKVENNRIGTNDAGNAAVANTGSGIHIYNGPTDSYVALNIIGGNDSHGISLTGSTTRDNLITENYIGTNASGTDLGNTGSGIHIGESAHDNTVDDNTIANNTGDGVTIISNGSIGNTVWENSIHTNGDLGIDLGDDGVTTNDTGETDSGPNSLQNFPTNLTFATRDGVASARFGLEVTANRVYIIDYYSSDSCDSSGNGEGQQWLGFTPAREPKTGNLTFTASNLQRTIGSYTAPTGTHITATATDTVLGSTSEFSTCFTPAALPELDISVDTVEATEDAATAATYTVALSAEPSADTKATLSISDDSVATIATTEYTFTTGNFNEPQTVAVTPVSDDDALNEITEILHLVSIGDNEYPTALLPVEVIDDDALRLTLTSTATEATFPSDVSVGHNYNGFLPLAEGDNSTYTVQLYEEPAGDVTIDLVSSDTSHLTAHPPVPSPSPSATRLQTSTSGSGTTRRL